MGKRKKKTLSNERAVPIQNELLQRWKTVASLREDMNRNKKVSTEEVSNAIQLLGADMQVGHAYITLNDITQNKTYKSLLPKGYLKFMGDLRRLQNHQPERILTPEAHAQYLVEQRELEARVARVIPEVPVNIDSSAQPTAKIKQILADFKSEIEGIDSHHALARATAQNLFISLDKKANHLSEKPTNLAEFIEGAKQDIIDALPTLQRDLGWGDYLVNLMKQLVNALTFGISSKFQPGFFEVKSSELARAATSALNDLDSAVAELKSTQESPLSMEN